MAAIGVPFLRANVGDRYVMQALREHGGILGGETSGHVLCLDRATSGDAIVSALQVLEVVLRRDCTLADAVADLHMVPQTTTNIRGAGGAALVAHSKVQHVLEDVRARLNDKGRVVLRPSGTEPLVRVTVEHEDAALVAQLVGELADAVRSAAASVQPSM